MKIKSEKRLKARAVEDPGAKGVTKVVLLGPEDGAEQVVMRLFRVEHGGHTPMHSHPWEHLVRITRGEGVVYSGSEGKFKIGPGRSIFIPAGEEHQFLNPYQEPLEFICVIPIAGA
ncbi:MAG TPA: cupin domain-containing protein [bacterium]|nr:cupin domain-containing protein [bacterium]HPQ66949.1 cupin domain-containing protein [bacterium]